MLRTLPAGFIAPCLPTKTDKLPSGDLWLHEIKHDGFRVIARKDGDRVRLYSRPGNDMTRRFPLIADALTGLRSRSCIIDGEAVACDDNGLASFERIRYRQHDGDVFLYAFDLIELNGDDMRRDPLEVRKATLRWPKLALACASTSIWKATARPSSPTRARWGSKASCRSASIPSTVPPLAGLAQVQEPGCSGGEARGRGGLGQAVMMGKNRIMIYGPKDDGTYVVEFRTAEGESLAISIPRTETAVIRHFQERMPDGLFVPDVP
jgi:ATP dependent DNA ligase-like protein